MEFVDANSRKKEIKVWRNGRLVYEPNRELKTVTFHLGCGHVLKTTMTWGELKILCHAKDDLQDND